MNSIRLARESLLKFWPLGEPWETLRQRIADDAVLMRIVARTSAATIAQEQTSRILFAAMAYLSRRHRFQIPSDSEWRSFISLRRSLLEHEDELTALLQRPAQVNDFRRCVGLYPGLLFAAQRVSKPIALVEVGPSLGLNLCLDLYCYEYSGLGKGGDVESRCRLFAEVDDLASRGRPGSRRAFPQINPAPVIGQRIGLELHPVSLEEDSVAWMRAFHYPRTEDLFDEALSIRRRTPIRIIKGDASRTLKQGLSLVPRNQVPLVFNTGVAYQMPSPVRKRFASQLAQGALHRRLFYMTWAEESARRGALLQVTDLNLAKGKSERYLLGFASRWDPIPKLEWVHSEASASRTKSVAQRSVWRP